VKGVKIPILEEESLSINVIGTHNGKVRGYELNSVFYKKGNRYITHYCQKIQHHTIFTHYLHFNAL
jgi:hypothetical protein